MVRNFTAQFTSRGPEAVAIRLAFVQVLGEIGTAKCLPILGRAANDPRDAATQAAARAAIDSVRGRADAAPSTRTSGQPVR